MKIKVSVLSLCFSCFILSVSGYSQIRTTKSSNEVVLSIQQIPVNKLDNTLAKLTFETWFSQAVGAKAGILWQMTECGEVITPNEANRDLKLCTEANAVMQDGRKIILMISVGRLRQGISGTPVFLYGVIEKGGEMYRVRKLRDLPEMLSGNLSDNNKTTYTTPVDLPSLSVDVSPVVIENPAINMSNIDGAMGGNKSVAADKLPPPPPGSMKEKTIEWSEPVLKVQPQYPSKARLFKAQGTVEVQITISTTGRVINAKAITGNLLLRDAALDAVRKWIFKQSASVTEQVITIDFKSPE